MQKKFLLFSVIIFVLTLIGTYSVLAQEGGESTSRADWKQEIYSDKQQIQEQKQEISADAQAARTEEEQLRQQIKMAMDAGNLQLAQDLKHQFRSVHQANLQEKTQDQQNMQAAKQELKSDIQDARQEGYLPPKRDKDNNPPGAKGGPGTNWENPPGPKGGPGASPNRKVN